MSRGVCSDCVASRKRELISRSSLRWSPSDTAPCASATSSSTDAVIRPSTCTSPDLAFSAIGLLEIDSPRFGAGRPMERPSASKLNRGNKPDVSQRLEYFIHSSYSERLAHSCRHQMSGEPCIREGAPHRKASRASLYLMHFLMPHRSFVRVRRTTADSDDIAP